MTGLVVAPEAPVLYDVFVATLGEEARLKGVALVRALREAGLRVFTEEQLDPFIEALERESHDSL